MPEVEKIRSAEKEADLDRKIEEIRRRNELIEERHKLVEEEAKQNGVPKSFQKATAGGGNHGTGSGAGGASNKSGSNHSSLKPSETSSSPKKVNGTESKGNNNQQWSREWDRGKTSAEEWKMNVPEFGDHGNSYFKSPNSDGQPQHGASRGRGAGRGGNFQQRGGRRPAPVKHNPGFFHDDRCEKTNGTKEEENGVPPTPGPDGKQEGPKKVPPRNNNYPRKIPNSHRNENDKNQNDSSKPNMNISNGPGPRQDRRNGPLPQSQNPRHTNTNGFRRPGASSKPQTETNGIKPAPKRNTEIQRKPFTKDDGKQPNGNSEHRQNPPANRGRNFKPYGKPASYSNPRQNKAHHPNTGGGKPHGGPKLDKDGQTVKRLVDNIIDQVVRQERKEQKKTENNDIVIEGENKKESNESKIEIVETKNEENKEGEEKTEENSVETEKKVLEPENQESKEESGEIKDVGKNEAEPKIEIQSSEEKKDEPNAEIKSENPEDTQAAEDKPAENADQVDTTKPAAEAATPAPPQQ